LVQRFDGELKHVSCGRQLTHIPTRGVFDNAWFRQLLNLSGRNLESHLAAQFLPLLNHFGIM
jgi:hypothetical protein